MAGFISYFNSWVAGITESIPPTIAASLGLANQFTVIRINGDETTLTHYLGKKPIKTIQFSGKNPTELSQNVKGGQVLLIPNNDSVSITLPVPKAAQDRLDQLLESEIERITPFRFSEVRVYHEVSSYESGQINLIIHLVPTNKFESLVDRARELGLKPETAVIEVKENLYEFAGNFVINESGRRNVNILRYAVMIGFIFLGLSSLSSPFMLREWKISKLTNITKRMSLQVERIHTKQSRLDQLQQEFEVISSFAKKSQNTLLLLEHITNALPDTAWLKQYSVKNNELILHGFAANASNVLGALTKLTHIKEPLFKSPIIREPGKDIERFHITAKLKM